MIRKIKVNKDKVPDIIRSFTIIKIAIDIASIEYGVYMDHNFKSPVVHNKLRQVKENIEHVKSYLQRYFIQPIDEETTDEVIMNMYDVMSLIMRLTFPQLEELKEQLKNQVKE